MWVTPYARAKGCQLFNNYDKSVITGPIALTLRMYVGTHPLQYFHVLQLGCDCDCVCAQIWYTDRDELVGCRESQLEATRRSSARAELNLSLARLSPPKGVLLVCICRKKTIHRRRAAGACHVSSYITSEKYRHAMCGLLMMVNTYIQS